MSFDSTYIDSSLFSDLMDLRILVERECVRLACAKLSPGKLDTLRRRTDAIYAADEEHMTDALYAYHKCLTEISGNAAYSMVFQSFEVMLHNLIQEHYKNRAELQKALPKFVYLTEAIARRDAFEADRQLLSVLSQASDYINAYLRNRSTSKI